jgi:hypothetical protein
MELAADDWQPFALCARLGSSRHDALRGQPFRATEALMFAFALPGIFLDYSAAIPPREAAWV